MSSNTKSRKANCLEDLRRRILIQDFEPGSYLDETRISEAYRISRPPLREILRQLAGDGYIALHPNRGAQVTPMTHKTLRNIFVAVPMIYAVMTRLAALHAKPDQIKRLKYAQFHFGAAIRNGDAARCALTNERFHTIIGEMADNCYLMPSLRRLLIDYTRIGMAFYDPRNRSLAEERTMAADQHDELIAQIEAGDVDAATDLATAYWQLARAEIESFVIPAGIRAPVGQMPDI